MADRIYPRDWTTLIPQEAARWVQQGVISEGQRDTILKLYPAAPAQERDRTTMILSILGSLLLGAGVILFFSANWAALPAWLKVGALLAAVGASYGVGYHLAFVRKDYPRLGHGLILLGALLYGASIWLIAQIFHLDSHYPNGFFMWAAGLLPVVWVLPSRPVLYLASLVLGIWTIMEQSQFASANYLYPVLLLAVVLPLARRLQTALVEAGVLGGLFLWFVINIAQRDLTGSQLYEIGVVSRFALLYGTALLAGGMARLGDQRAFLGIGALITLGGSYFLTFGNRYLSSGPEITPSLFWGSPFLLAGTGLVLVALVAGAFAYWRRAESGRYQVLSALLIPVVAAASLHLMNPVPRMVTFNLMLFAGTIGLIVLGISRRMELLINLGLGVFVIHTFTRYVDLFFTAMDRSLFFMLGGILLLGGGWLLERNRRRWVGEFGGGNHDA